MLMKRLPIYFLTAQVERILFNFGFGDMCRGPPNLNIQHRQLAFADRVLLNKCDLVDEASVE